MLEIVNSIALHSQFAVMSESTLHCSRLLIVLSCHKLVVCITGRYINGIKIFSGSLSKLRGEIQRERINATFNKQLFYTIGLVFLLSVLLLSVSACLVVICTGQ